MKTRVRAGNLLALVNKDSVDIQRGFLLNSAVIRTEEMTFFVEYLQTGVLEGHPLSGLAQS